MPHYYDIDGHPLDLMEWCELFEQRKPTDPADAWWRIGHDQIGDMTVSTVWMGLDHNWTGGPPLIFESMVFGDPLSDEQYRYATKEQAAEGHARLVRDWWRRSVRSTHWRNN